MILSHETNQWAFSNSGLIIPKSLDSDVKKLPKAFDFFAGAGGFSCGLHSAGFHVVGAMELSYDAAHTYLVNLATFGKLKVHFDDDDRAQGFENYMKKHLDAEFKRTGVYGGNLAGSGWISQHGGPGCEHFWIADIRNLTGEMILKELGMKRGDLDLVVGGPPCQGFSHAGKREVDDPRNNLVFEYARLIVELWPKTFVMENVPGIVSMTTPEGIPIIDGFMRILADADYSSYANLQKMLGVNPNARRVLRKENNQEFGERGGKEKKPSKKVLASAAKVSQQPALSFEQ